MSSKQIVLSSRDAQTVIPYAIDKSITDADTKTYYGYDEETVVAKRPNISKYKTLTVQISNELDQGVNVWLVGRGFHLTQQIGDKIYVGTPVETHVTISLLEYQVRYLSVYAKAVGIPTTGTLTILVLGTP